MQRLLIMFLSFNLFACASPEERTISKTELDLAWEFCEIVPMERRACLKEEDVKALRRKLSECEVVK